MVVGKLAEKLDMRIISAGDGVHREVTGVYCCDLLSWVMSHANKGDAWITVLTNLNIVAVALLAEISCVIIPEGITIDKATVEKAQQEGIVILSTDMGTYEICWRIHNLM